MPELPEVETVRRGLEPAMVGRRVVRMETRREGLRFPFARDLDARLSGRRIEKLTRRAKYILVHVEGGDVLLLHLGMTGRFSVWDATGIDTLGQYVHETSGDPKHDHAVMHLSGGTRIVYNDPRRFGFMVLMSPQEAATHPLLEDLGPEPLSDALTAAALAGRAAGKKVNLKALLMDQRVVAGLGNIYVCEALYRAGLSPNRAAKSLATAKGAPHARASLLVDAIKAVLEEAVAAGGSTLRDYRHADGARGAFQERFAVYGREGEPCVRRGCTGTVRRVIHTGRSTFYCPVCQR